MTTPSLLSIKTIWGKVVLYLRENKNVALHVVCGDITQVELENNDIVLKTDEQFLYDMLMEENNQEEIKKALAWQGLNYGIKVVKLKKDDDFISEDFSKLNALGIKFRKI